MLPAMHPVQHLLGRMGFGLSPDEWEHYREQATDRIIDDLLQQSRPPRSLSAPTTDYMPADPRMISQEERLEMVKKRLLQTAAVNAQWLQRMADPAEPALLERMCLFWHGHFACDIKGGDLAISYLNILRSHGLGHFGDLVKAIAREPAMIRYLNNQQNRKEQPNENFARELLELFTIGRGNYTEQDIKEAARAFTGWSSTLRGTYVFRRQWHDYSVKTFMGRRGRFDGDDIIDIILERKETAGFIAGKLYRYFVHPDGHAQREAELAAVFYESNYHIGRTMEHLMRADWFYAPENWRAQIKSPVVLLAGLMRTLGVSAGEPLPLVYVQRVLGQVLFRPPNVAGWPGGRQWIDNATLMNRLNLAQAIIQGRSLPGRAKDDLKAKTREDRPEGLRVEVDLKPLLQIGQAPDIRQMQQQLTDYILPGMPLPTSLLSRYARGKTPEEETAFTAIRLLSMPEYQLC